MKLGYALILLGILLGILVWYGYTHPESVRMCKDWCHGVYDYWVNVRFFAKPVHIDY